MLTLFVALLPWLLVGAFAAFGIREPRALPASPAAGAPLPPVSIVVPARNEAANLPRLLGSLARLRYPDFEIVVVDDGSTDGTADIARAASPGNARALRVVEAGPLPEGWFGKPWACARGAEEARGEILLFTDADTRHAPDLLARAIAALEEDGAGALTLLGAQEMESFWERLVQPHVFFLLAVRYPRLDRPVRDPARARNAIANGQYILIRREAYAAVGGHRSVRGEVVEDLRLAQVLVSRGVHLAVRGADDALSTRMYASLGGLLEGWTKNMAMGVRQTTGWWGRGAIPLFVIGAFALWLAPLVAGAGGVAMRVAGSTHPQGGVLAWAALAFGVSAGVWGMVHARFRSPVRYALLHPLGAAVVIGIALRSWGRGGRRIEWKGRRYRVDGGQAPPAAPGEHGGPPSGDAGDPR